MWQLTVGKQNCPIFIALLAVLAQYCAWSYSTKRQLLHRRHMPCLLGTDSPDSSPSHGLWINLLVFSNRQMEVEGLPSSVFQLTNVWLISMICNCNEKNQETLKSFHLKTKSKLLEGTKKDKEWLY
jgi:hypothetical protein